MQHKQQALLILIVLESSTGEGHSIPHISKGGSSYSKDKLEILLISS